MLVRLCSSSTNNERELLYLKDEAHFKKIMVHEQPKKTVERSKELRIRKTIN